MSTIQKIKQYFEANDNQPVQFYTLLACVDASAGAVIRNARKMIEAGELVEVREDDKVLWKLKAN